MDIFYIRLQPYIENVHFDGHLTLSNFMDTLNDTFYDTLTL